MPITIVKTKKRSIYKFGPINEGSADLVNTLGGKGAFLAELVKIGVPVPPGFTFPCETCVTYLNEYDHKIIDAGIKDGLAYLEGIFGYMPLLSVRSGARVSMPGMMDTILNVGLHNDNLQEWSDRIGARATSDSYRRLLQMYGSIVFSIPMEEFESKLSALKKEQGLTLDSELTESHLFELIKSYEEIYSNHNAKLPQSLIEQLQQAILSVFGSWDNPRAQEYRNIYGYPHTWGTAATVQAMVFGNLNDQSGSGVLFTRDPSTGEPLRTGDWLPNAQGEDVVAGIRETIPVAKMIEWNNGVFDDLMEVAKKLETQFKDMQDIEFTIQDGELFILQTRPGKRSSKAAFAIAVDMVGEGLISKKEAVSRFDPASLFSSMTDHIDPSFTTQPDAIGVPSGGGVVTGTAALGSDAVMSAKGDCILVTKETNPEDISAINKSVGILTFTGGLTSHAAVVARGMNKSCVVGASDLQIIKDAVFGSPDWGPLFSQGDKITIDGSTGKVWKGEVPIIKGEMGSNERKILDWAVEGLNVVERLDLRPGMTVNEMKKTVRAATSKKLWVDSASLEGPSLLSDLIDLGKVLEVEAHDKSIVLDFRDRHHYLEVHDCYFDTVFELSAENVLEKMQAIAEWPLSIRPRVTVISTTKLDTDSDTKDGWGGFVFKEIKVAKTFADILDSKAYLTVSDEDIQKAFGSREAFNKAVELVSKENGQEIELPKSLYWYQFLKEAKCHIA